MLKTELCNASFASKLSNEIRKSIKNNLYTKAILISNSYLVKYKKSLWNPSA